jgi:hypothetical protein
VTLQAFCRYCQKSLYYSLFCCRRFWCMMNALVNLPLTFLTNSTQNIKIGRIMCVSSPEFIQSKSIVLVLSCQYFYKVGENSRILPHSVTGSPRHTTTKIALTAFHILLIWQIFRVSVNIIEIKSWAIGATRNDVTCTLDYTNTKKEPSYNLYFSTPFALFNLAMLSTVKANKSSIINHAQIWACMCIF